MLDFYQHEVVMNWVFKQHQVRKLLFHLLLLSLFSVAVWLVCGTSLNPDYYYYVTPCPIKEG